MTEPGTSLAADQFVEKWKGRRLSERGGSHVHFIELCQVLSVPYPHQHRTDDTAYCFDALTDAAGSRLYAAAKKGKGRRGRDASDDGLWGKVAAAASSSGGQAPGPAPRIVSAPSEGHGWADVWKQGHFCWEYKRQGKHADLAAALIQLKTYKDSLDNPPLLIVCDIDRFEIHTNFTGHPAAAYEFDLEDLATPSSEWRERGVSPLSVLRNAFTDPEWFRPKKTVNDITEELATKIAEVARAVEERRDGDGKRVDPHDVAHFLMQLVFALFAEDVGLLPSGLVTEVIRSNIHKPERFQSQIRALFRAMETGGDFGTHGIEHFNGGLFTKLETQRIPRLVSGEIGLLSIVAQADWSAVEPSILGTLFERSLNPQKRSQIGAHYTSRDDIIRIVEPVVLAPLREEWDAVRSAVAGGKANSAAVRAFASRLATLRVLDPACGSGNFLYVAIQCLLDLEKQVVRFAAEHGVNVSPKVNPTQLNGLEINDYAAELARISIWIGYLKWQRENGKTDPGRRPILDALDTIRNQDAILERGDPKKPKPAAWPAADFIIGNPPFLGSKMFRKWGLDDEYLGALFASYELPKTSDLCCYWFERARQIVEKAPATRVGLLATQAIRGGDNRAVLKRIKSTGDIFMAWSDRLWTLDGAAVQVSIVCFDGGKHAEAVLDNAVVGQINSNLTADVDTASAKALPENAGIAFMGDTKGGPFDIDWQEAARLFVSPNPNGRPNTEVVRPWVNGLDITRRPRGMFIVDFGCNMSRDEATRYEAPFAHVERGVQTDREKIRDAGPAARWWLHNRPRPDMRHGLAALPRFLSTPTLTKHRLFTWLVSPTLPDHQVIVFGRPDDYFLGLLHSCVHEVWARRLGTQLREAESGFRYTPTSCFDTFPLPWRPGSEPTEARDDLPKRGGRTDAQRGRGGQHALWKEIADSAAELNQLREQWLNPPELIAGVERSVEIRCRRELEELTPDARAMVRRASVMAASATHDRLSRRTLTNLYNERPAWLRDAHARLDRAVLASYAMVDPEGRWDPAWASAFESHGTAEIEATHDKTERAERDEARRSRAGVEEKILVSLLRLNLERSG